MSYTSIPFSLTVDHFSDVTVLENQASALPGFSHAFSKAGTYE
jgi:hypothetical protein